MKYHINFLAVAAIILIVCQLPLATSSNLLFVVVDDLRPELSVYDKPWSYTPNFERLANHSVTFDLAFAQVAVCNPSRDSMLTGLRPDAVGVHNFQASFRPHMPFFSHLKDAGVSTFGIGKIFNWDGEDSTIWSSHESFNSPAFSGADATIRVVDESESVFVDYQSTTAAINRLKSQSSSSKPFAIGLGLGATHPMTPVPKKYFDMITKYKESHPWPIYRENEMTFPKTAPIQSYHCCVSPTVDSYFRKAKRRSVTLPAIPSPMQADVYNELMWGYLSAIAFIDSQIGRLIDAVDELNLWGSLTIIVTSDHGMHVGEKGIWDKWTLFDESTHVPLFIHHPQSPFEGDHFKSPVELLDLFPTVLSLMDVAYVKPKLPSTIVPQGRSLEYVVMGREGDDSSKHPKKISPALLTLRQKTMQLKFNFALSQVLICSNSEWEAIFDVTGQIGEESTDEIIGRHQASKFWSFCNADVKAKVALMGYSVRTKEFRYTAYIPVDPTSLAPDFSQGSEVLPWAEELYDHRDESTWSTSAMLATVSAANTKTASNEASNGANGDDGNTGNSGSVIITKKEVHHDRYGKWELVNVVDDPHYAILVAHYRATLIDYLRKMGRYAKLPIEKHGRDFLDYQKQFKSSSFSSNTNMLGSFASSGSNVRFKSFDSLMKKKSNQLVTIQQQSPQREWQSKQSTGISLVDTRTKSNELYGGTGNHGVNLLLIMFDDLRPELSIYGRQHMITPNFERLAKKSVVFDYCFTQVAVCNPSRNVMLTGLRPDTKRTYAFDAPPDPHLVLPTSLKRIGYETVQAGKLFHWDGPNPDIWDSYWDWDWYGYQNKEWDFMKSTVMPDKQKPEESFPDYEIATEIIKQLRKFHTVKSDQKFMAAAGFKMPHTSLHIPYRFFDMYRNLTTTDVWKLTEEERSYSITKPSHSFRCCTDSAFRFMNQEGEEAAVVNEGLGDIKHTMSQAMYTENMWGYSAAVSFVDYQLGRILDVLDELDMWKNLTIVLSADHGMHNGEKGIWEKWTLFDESTRVPLMIHHPQSPFHGMRYTKPVEHVDIFPTIHDLIGAPFQRVKKYVYKPNSVVVPLSGKSLAPVIFGSAHSAMGLQRRGPASNSEGTGGSANVVMHHGPVMPTLNKTIAISQILRCVGFDSLLRPEQSSYTYINHDADNLYNSLPRVVPWENDIFHECDMNNRSRTDELPFMGYSMRTSRFRYTAWVLMNRSDWMPTWDLLNTVGPYAEELYDHRNEKLSDFTHLEVVNLAQSSTYRDTVLRLRKVFLNFLKTEVIFSPYGIW